MTKNNRIYIIKILYIFVQVYKKMREVDPMRLGATEKQLKTYNYYQTSDDHSGTLVVTDRRLVQIERSKHGESHSEIRIKDIASVECGYRRYAHSPAGLVLMLLGIIVAIGGFVFFKVSGEIDAPNVLAFPVMAVGAVLFVIGLVKFLAKSMAMFLIITTEQREGLHSMGVYVSNKPSDKLGSLLRKMKNDKTRVKMTIDEDAAMDMVNELSAIVWEVQAAGTAHVSGYANGVGTGHSSDATSDSSATTGDFSSDSLHL